GTPTELKRTVGQDVIVVRIDGDAAAAVAAIRPVEGVGAVDRRGDELFVSAEHGAATGGPGAVALADTSGAVRDITLRTPTLDDVFLELTGSRMRTGESSSDDGDGDGDGGAAPNVPPPNHSEPVEALR